MRPRVSDHAVEQWIRRRFPSDIDLSIEENIVRAWHHGERLERHNLYGDEVRYHIDSGAVLVRKNGCIRTVMDHKTTDGATRESIRAVVA